MDEVGCAIGMIGLGVMGRNLVLNMAGHGSSVAGYDQDASKVQSLQAEAGTDLVQGALSLPVFVASLRRPRNIIMLVPAGPPVDAVIRELLQYLEHDDLIIDGGNSYFKDTDLRAKTLAAHDLSYMGVGISGGEHGARTGPSLMPGGPRAAYERVQPIFEAVAAQVGGEPCVTYLGPGSAGHYVKMVHNGIEYGLMELIAESYDLLKRGEGLDDDRLHEVYDRWNQTELSAYLIEITANIFCQPDDKTGKRLIDVILDEARQKGTGMWTSQDAMDLGVPTPSIDAAVAMRNLSALKAQREAASRVLARPVQPGGQELPGFLNQLYHAMYAGMLIVYAQGLAQLRQASAAYGYDLNLADVARIWRGGCIIRSALLEPIRAAYQSQPDLTNLLMDPHLSARVMSCQEDLRAVVGIAAQSGIPAPGLAASLAYLDAYRSDWLPANLIQAQRDYFGAHTYERVDSRGTFHTRWEGE